MVFSRNLKFKKKNCQPMNKENLSNLYWIKTVPEYISAI